MTARTFRERLRERERLLGTFVKTAAYQVVEVLGTTALDFVVIDAEHAPFDRNQLDVCMLAARAARLSALVRIPNNASDTVLNVLDVGATGLLVPHALNAAGVRQVLATARYRSGVRGFSNSPRAGGCGRIGMGELIEIADRDTAVVCQIEDREAVENINDLARHRRCGLPVHRPRRSRGLPRRFDLGHQEVDAAVKRGCAACAGAGKAVGVYLGDGRDIRRYEDLGATLFVIGSDQSLLRAQAAALAGQFGQA